jgi:hypothetical protein
MATKVILTCDRCKQTTEKLWEIGITCEPLGDYVYRSQFHVIRKQQKTEWCEPCVKEMDINRPLLRAQTITPSPTIEDMIREIVRSEQNGGS